jgi:hypothetical protein
MNDSPFIVCYQSHPVRFVTNLAKRYSICHVDEASEFATREEAELAIVNFGLRGNGRVSIRRKVLPEPLSKFD